MSRSVCGIAVAFALLVGGAMLTTESSANAGHHGCGGGLFGKHRGHAVQRGCGGGLFSRLHARRQASCCAPEPVCCAPQPVCCAPEPVCCAPQPTCCEPAPVAQGCCPTGGVYGGSVMGAQGVYQQPGAYDQQYQQGGQQYQQGGQQLQQESQQLQQEGQQLQQEGQVQGDAEVPSASDAPRAPQADAASDAPPAPQPE